MKFCSAIMSLLTLMHLSASASPRAFESLKIDFRYQEKSVSHVIDHQSKLIRTTYSDHEFKTGRSLTDDDLTFISSEIETLEVSHDSKEKCPQNWVSFEVVAKDKKTKTTFVICRHQESELKVETDRFLNTLLWGQVKIAR